MICLGSGSLVFTVLFTVSALLGSTYTVVPAVMGAVASGLALGRLIEHRQSKNGRGIQDADG